MKRLLAIICIATCFLGLCGCVGINMKFTKKADIEEITLYNAKGNSINILKSEQENYLRNGYYCSYKEVLESLKESLDNEILQYLGENHNRLCDFTSDDISKPEFARTWIFYRFTGIDNGGGYVGGRIPWRKTVIAKEYKLYFGVDIPDFINDHNVVYDDGIYYIGVSNPGQIYGVIEKVTVLEHYVELVYQLKDTCDGGRDFNSKAIYKIAPADNENGFILLSKQTKRIDESRYGTEHLEPTNEKEVDTESEYTAVSYEKKFVVTEKLSTFPKEFEKEYIFCSGVGAWQTRINIGTGGVFSGQHRDSDIGVPDAGYDSTEYECDFQGKFEILGKIDEYSYLVKLLELTQNRKEGERWIENRVQHIVSSPYGLDGGETFVLYLPQTPVDSLDEEFLSWWPFRFADESERPNTLLHYGIYNINTGDGIFSNEQP